MTESGGWKKITIHADGGCDGNPGLAVGLATVSPGSGSKAMPGTRITNDATNLLRPKS
jgi:ribonuclease HI